MLAHLQLKDLVIVDQAELELRAGMTALTGETGAGKSIVVDALLLVAGGRAGSDVVRQGAERAEVSATFTHLPSAAVAFLERQSIEHDDELIVRRVIGADGRSRAYLNGQVVPLQALRELAAALIEIHGQQEFQRLVNRAAQRDLLDARLADAHVKQASGEAYGRYQAAKRAHEALAEAVADRDARLDLLRYQVQELSAEVGSAESIEELFVEVKRHASKGRLGGAARAALEAVSEADGANAHDLLSRAQSLLRAVEGDPQLAGALGLLGEASILAQEAAQSLRAYLEALDVDPARQEELERRAAALEALARKHRVAVGELPAVHARLAAELTTLENASSNLAALLTTLDQARADYVRQAQVLSAARKDAAQILSKDISGLMQALSMAGGRFQVAVSESAGEPSFNGMDDIEFLVSANPGQPLKPLAKVASGGELSRISLAVQVAAAGADAALCMVFDEVDAGIGGAVAEIVGKQLRTLGERNQVLCVTHLPQVASQAHQQYRVLKLTDGKVTRTALKALTAEQRVEEIARMLGGVDITAQARAHAREMLDRGQPASGAEKKKRSRSAR